MSLHHKLSQIQSKLTAPKGQYNSFGKYHYRNCEDILQALKPHLAEHGCYVTLTDDIQAVAGRIYVKATATITDGESSITATAYARESESKKGMDDSQLTGATSSYARKYALNGLFAIDDNKDADTLNSHQNYTAQNQKQTLDDERFANACTAVQAGKFDKKRLLTEYDLTPEQRQKVMKL